MKLLTCEGYVISRQGAPTRVAGGLDIKKTAITINNASKQRSPEILANFRTGQPELRLFPRYLWQQFLTRAAGSLPIDGYGYDGPQGIWRLRNEISAWLMRNRGFNALPDDIFITSGATYALHLLSDIFCTGGKKVIMEDPCHSGMLHTIKMRGGDVAPVPVDERGIVTQCLPDGKDIGAIYVTPSHQFPLGGILPAARRAALIRYAREHRAYIIEDDYDSEFRYQGEPVAPLATLDGSRVVYVGTFSKALFPALRIGYAVPSEGITAALAASAYPCRRTKPAARAVRSR